VSSGETLKIDFLPVNSSGKVRNSLINLKILESQQQWSLKIDFVNIKDTGFEVDSIQLLVPFKVEMNSSGLFY
jgi:hypothetical protein